MIKRMEMLVKSSHQICPWHGAQMCVLELSGRFLTMSEAKHVFVFKSKLHVLNFNGYVSTNCIQIPCEQ